MEKVLGIGGVFLKARDPQALADWYREHLGISIESGQTHGVMTSDGAGEMTGSPRCRSKTPANARRRRGP